MSWLGLTIGRPFAGLSTFCVLIMSTCASICAFAESGTWTAIWSPSKSALNAVQTKGWILMAFPSTRTGWNA